jgi:deoxyhypusine synthase
MARFALGRDIKFFEGISRELVDAVVTTAVVLYKLIIEDSKTNLYGESLSKTYYQGVDCNAIIERGDTQVVYEGFGADTNQTTQFRFNRFTLADKEFYPEIGDIIFHNDAYFEIDNVIEDQLIGGRTGDEEHFSIVCSTFMTRKSTIQTEMRII